MKIFMPYAHRALATFAQTDVEILRERHDVDVMPFQSWFDALRAAARVRRADILVCWFGSARYLPALVVARILGRPIVVVAGGYDVANVPAIQYGNMQGGLTRLLGQLVFRLATRVLAFSNAAVGEAQQFAHVPAAKIRRLYLGFDANRVGADIPIEAKERLVLTVGHLNPSSIVRKGVLTIVRASRLLPDATFVVAGHGDAETMRLLSAEAGENVVFTGAVSDEARNTLLRRAKVYCQPSLHEGFGAAVAEAMLFNCVPVISPNGSLPEVAGPHARFVKPGDPVALAAELRAALDAGSTEGETARAFITHSFPLGNRRNGLLQELDELRGRAESHS